MPDSAKIITTEDGSHSIFLPTLNETYHSFHGAVQESRHVFLKEGLQYWINRSTDQPEKASILEIGMGTGLNVLLTLEYALQNALSIDFDTIEKYPVEISLAAQLNYVESCNIENAAKAYEDIHQAIWNISTAIHDLFTIHKYQDDLISMNIPNKAYDLVYFDAFAPSKQPEMWEEAVFEKIYSVQKVGGILTTYSAQGKLKRTLQGVGYEVEKIPGPPGKREMIRAIKKPH